MEDIDNVVTNKSIEETIVNDTIDKCKNEIISTLKKHYPDELLDINTELTKSCNTDFSKFTLKIDSTIHYPEIDLDYMVDTHKIYDLYVKLVIIVHIKISNYTGKINSVSLNVDTINGNRATFTDEELITNYSHPHLSTSSTGQFRSFCLGESYLKSALINAFIFIQNNDNIKDDIKDDIEDDIVNKAINSFITNLELLLILLNEFVAVEARDGIPFIRTLSLKDTLNVKLRDLDEGSLTPFREEIANYMLLKIISDDEMFNYLKDNVIKQIDGRVYIDCVNMIELGKMLVAYLENNHSNIFNYMVNNNYIHSISNNSKEQEKSNYIKLLTNRAITDLSRNLNINELFTFKGNPVKLNIIKTTDTDDTDKCELNISIKIIKHIIKLILINCNNKIIGYEYDN